EIVDVVEKAAGELADRGIEIARYRNVDEEERCAAARGNIANAQDRIARRRRGHDHVDLPKPSRRLRELESRRAEPIRETLGGRTPPARDERNLCSARGEVRRGELPDPASAEQQHATPRELTEDLGRERRGGRRDRRRALADRRLAAHALADGERLAKDTVEHRPRRHRFIRGPHLSEDLALAGNERVEAGRDAEEVTRCINLVQPIGDVGERLACEELERGDRLGLVDPGEIELGAIARREAHRVAERAREPRSLLHGQGHPLTQLHRRDVVRQPDDGERRHAKWLPASARRATITSTNPPSARYAAREPLGRSATNTP